jgi:hypothetical protein
MWALQTRASGWAALLLTQFAAACVSGCGNEPKVDSIGDSEDSPPAVDSESANSALVPTTDMDLLFRINVGPRHTVSFYEPQPGLLYTIEGVPNGGTGILQQLATVTAVEVFKRARPGEEVPAVLVEADDRAQPKSRIPGDDTVSETPPGAGGGAPFVRQSEVTIEDGVGTVRQAHATSNAPDFVNNHLGCDYSTFNRIYFTFCRVNWGGGFWSSATADFSKFVVHAFSGNGVTVRQTVHTNIQDISVPNGGTFSFHVSFQQFNLPQNILFRWDVFNAEGDGFHVGGAFFDQL